MTAGAGVRLDAAALESVLGELARPGGPFDPAVLARLDEAEEFPGAACAELDAAGLPDWYVPARHGGALTELPELVAMLRAVARRDLTVAIAHGKTLLGAMPVWVAGTPDQAAALGARVRAGAVVSWGLTEREHGSDLLAGELTASRQGHGWVLDGTKWLINNATRADAVCVLARTRPEGGPRGFSLLLADVGQPWPGTVERVPKLRTHGIRGADISGVVFTGAVLPPGALVGGEGDGIETTLKALQLTRTTCVALSLGAGDHAVEIAAAFLGERVLYRRRLVEVPRMRRLLGEACAGVLLAEAVAVVAARSAHTLPGELSVVAAIAKAFVPVTVEQSIEQLAELLGTRGFLTEAYRNGEFAKLERDHRIVGLFDGSTLVNRAALITQLPRLAAGASSADVAGAVGLDLPLPELDPARLRLVSRTGCAVVGSLPDALAGIRAAHNRGELPGAVAELAGALADAVAGLQAELASQQPAARDVPASAFRLAERYELCFAGAACLHLWLANPDRRDDPLWARGRWVRACLALVLTRLGVPVPGADEAFEAVTVRLLAAGGRLSLLDRAVGAR